MSNQMVITIMTGLISFLTMLVVTVIAYVITRQQKSVDRAHVRIDDFEREVRREFVSEPHCKSMRSSKPNCD